MVKLKGHTMIETVFALSIILFVFVASLSLYLRLVSGSGQLFALEIDREVKRIVSQIGKGEKTESTYTIKGLRYEITQTEQGNLLRVDIQVENESFANTLFQQTLFLKTDQK